MKVRQILIKKGWRTDDDWVDHLPAILSGMRDEMLELFDIDALVARHPEDPQIAALKPLVRATSSMYSVCNDLKRAVEMMAACQALSRAMRAAAECGTDLRRDDAATVQALSSQAVLLYARATHTGGKGRNKLHITQHFDEDQRAAHHRITALQDEYLAHFDDPKSWEQHRVVLALDLTEGQMALSYPHASAYIQVPDAMDLERMLAVALPIAQQQSAKVSNKLNLAIDALFDSRPEFLTELRDAPFDPEAFFDPEEMQPYLDGIGRLDPDTPTAPRIGRPHLTKGTSTLGRSR